MPAWLTIPLALVLIAGAVATLVIAIRSRRVSAIVMASIATVTTVLVGLSTQSLYALAAVPFIAIALYQSTHKPPPEMRAATSPSTGTPADRMNSTAVASIILVFFSSVVGMVLGYVAIYQIGRTGERGYGLAFAATMIGWIWTILGGVLAVFLVGTVLLHH